MRRITVQIVSLVLAASLFTGCSVTNTASDTPGASGGAVSGSVAAEDEEIEPAGRNQSYMENSDNRYDILYEEDRDECILAQYRLDGTLVKKGRIEGEDIEWVTDEWLYYGTIDKKENDILWRIPIKKTAKGDRLLTDKKEKVLKAWSIDVSYITDTYIIAEIWDGKKEHDGVCKYELGSGKLTPLIPYSDEEDEAECLWTSEYPIMWQGELFFEGLDEVYLLDPEKEQVSSICPLGGSEDLDDCALTGNEFYFLINNKLYQYNCSSKKLKCVIPEKEFLKEVRKLKLGRVGEIYIDEMYLNQGRLYFFTDVLWTGKDANSKKELSYNKDELFSVAIDDLEGIRHEDKLMDYLDKKGKYENSEWGGENGMLACHTSWLDGAVDGKIVAAYQKGKENCRYVLYDLQTGEIEDMAEDKLPKEYDDLL